ncbi:MAG: GSCFA domain-containing protein [Bergeyella sp.]
MKFRTEVEIKISDKKIEPEDKIFSVGSCFATEISGLLSEGQLQTVSNPFGTIFNPHSVNIAVKRLHDSDFYTEEDLIVYNNDYISLEHHTDFDFPYAHRTLEKINSEIEKANLFLQQTNWVFITYGTSFIYEFLPKNQLVANCHKIPQKFFEKRMLSTDEIIASIQETILNLKDICPEGVQILFTVSPVRHTKDGISENLWSKSRLINALHEVVHELDYCHYLPVYEILMDDLRDYRFYKDDLIHPNSQAVNYIFEKFGNAYFSQETKDFITENFKINQALNHRTSDKNNAKYVKFMQNINERIEVQRKKVKHKIF